MRVMLTGGTGTVGLAVAEYLLNRGMDVLVLASTPAPEVVERALRRTSAAVEFVEGDVRDRERLSELMRSREIDAVVHGAAITPDANRERSRPWQVLDVNCVGAVTVAETLGRERGGRFVYLGSIAAYGAAAADLPVLREEAGDERPVTLYQISKLAGEQAALRVAELLGLSAVSLRLGDVFGRWERPTVDRDATSAPFQTLDLALRGESVRLPRAGRKAWVYTVDVARAVHAALVAETLPHRVVNVSSPFVWSVADWCDLLRTEFPALSYGMDTRSPNVALFDDNAPMALERAEQLGYTARFDLPTAFRDYIEWMRATQ